MVLLPRMGNYAMRRADHQGSTYIGEMPGLFTQGHLRINETSPSNLWREFAVAWGKQSYTIIRDLEGLLYIRQVNHKNQYNRASKKLSKRWLLLFALLRLLLASENQSARDWQTLGGVLFAFLWLGFGGGKFYWQ